MLFSAFSAVKGLNLLPIFPWNPLISRFTFYALRITDANKIFLAPRIPVKTYFDSTRYPFASSSKNLYLHVQILPPRWNHVKYIKTASA